MRLIFKILLITAIIFSLLPFDLHAAPCYGTKMPKAGDLFGGFAVHVVLDRDLEDGFGSLRSNQEFFQVSYGIFDWLSLDLKGGAGNLKQHPIGSDEIDYPSAFGGGYGVRFKIYDTEKIKAVFGFQHISVHPRSVRINGGQRNKAILDDWQVSLLASYELEKFTPYLGTKWSRIDYIHWVDGNRKRRMSNRTKSIGVVFGMDVPLFANTWLNLEGQFIDVEAFSFSYNFKF